MATEEGWVGVKEVAAHLRVAKESVYRWVESKGFPARRVGRLLRFKLSEVDEWVKNGGGDDSRLASPGLSSTSKAKTNRFRVKRKGVKKNKHE
jgi:excisionase family DNA binding protein